MGWARLWLQQTRRGFPRLVQNTQEADVNIPQYAYLHKFSLKQKETSERLGTGRRLIHPALFSVRSWPGINSLALFPWKLGGGGTAVSAVLLGSSVHHQNGHMLINHIWPDDTRNAWQGPRALGFPEFSHSCNCLLKGPWLLISEILPGDVGFVSQRNPHNYSGRPCPHTWVSPGQMVVSPGWQSARLPRFILNGTWGVGLLCKWDLG